MQRSLKCIQTLDGHNDRVWCVNWNCKGNLLASCGGDKTIRIWGEEGDRWVCKSILTGAHSRTVRCVAFSPCGRYLASASFDSTIVVWDRKDEQEFEPTTTLEGHENEAKGVAWSPSGRFLASCSRDKSVWVWEADEDEDFQCCSILSSHSQDVKFVTWHPQEDILISASYDNSIKFYTFDGDDWSVQTSLENAHESTVWSLAFDNSGKKFASCGDDLRVKIWSKSDVSGGRWLPCSTLSGYHTRPVYFVDWCNRTSLLATASGDNGVRVFELSDSMNDEPVLQMTASDASAHSQDVNCVRFNPTRPEVLASCSDDGAVKLWKIADA